MGSGFGQLAPDEYVFTDPVTGDQRVGKIPSVDGSTPPRAPTSDEIVAQQKAAQEAAAQQRMAGSNREAWGAPPPGMLTQPGGRAGVPDNAVVPRFGVSAAPQLFRDRNAKPEEARIRTQSAWGSGLPPGLAAAGQRRMDYGAGEGGGREMQKPVFKPGLGGGQGQSQYGMANIPVKR